MTKNEEIIKNKIESFLGKSENLTIEDAIRYFTGMYGAKEIDPQYAINYRSNYYCSEEEKEYWKNKGLIKEDISIGIDEITYEHEGEYPRVILFTTEEMLKADPNFDKIVKYIDLKQSQRKFKGSVGWRENSIIIMTTVDGKKILQHQYEGLSGKLECECEFFTQHSIGDPEISYENWGENFDLYYDYDFGKDFEEN